MDAALGGGPVPFVGWNAATVVNDAYFYTSGWTLQWILAMLTTSAPNFESSDDLLVRIDTGLVGRLFDLTPLNRDGATYLLGVQDLHTGHGRSFVVGRLNEDDRLVAYALLMLDVLRPSASYFGAAYGDYWRGAAARRSLRRIQDGASTSSTQVLRCRRHAGTREETSAPTRRATMGQ